jgi:uncharacterized protein (DUF924 family)
VIEVPDDLRASSDATVPADWAAQLLAFWFDGHGMKDWFGGGAAFDDALRARFADWHGALRSLPPEAFLTDVATARAAIILFDQVPRNLHRHHADAFATDALALAIAREVDARGWDTGLSAEQASFVYLPFEHSEALADQRESLRLMTPLGGAFADYAQRHFAMIERFGRFPHRNRALGRADRDGEAAAVAAGNDW